jgi:hypothetical protein
MRRRKILKDFYKNVFLVISQEMAVKAQATSFIMNFMLSTQYTSKH